MVLAAGNQLIYSETYEQALEKLTGLGQAVSSGPLSPTAQKQRGVTASEPPPSSNDPRVGEIRQHLRRYRDSLSQGKYAEAGKELEAIEALAGRP